LDQHRRGIWLGVGAYVIWGLAPVYWNLVDGIDELEILANRILWALVMLWIIVTGRRLWARLRAVYASAASAALAVIGAILLAANWGTFIWAVTNDHIVDASLGYFMTPLVSVGLGVIVLREHLRRAQWLAVVIAAGGVVWMTLALGTLPWVSLVLAFAFGFYGLIKKNPRAASALEGLFGEVVIVAIPATYFIVASVVSGESSLAESPTTTTWLIGAGAVTVVPLLLFGASAQLIPLSTVGLIQYLAPTLQLLVGVIIFNESLSGPQIVGFVAVWIALAVFTRDQVAQSRERSVFSS
jgi:chloramphenicol-sensitive protein RarD